MTEPWKSKSILIVDDAPRVRKELRLLYQSLGLEIFGEAASGIEAITMVRAKAPDFVSLDIIMPEMDGIECFRTLRQNYPHIRSFFVSSLAAEPRVVKSYENEIRGELFVAKPQTEEAILRALRSFDEPPMSAAPTEPIDPMMLR